jgi:hypothetical protein
LVVKTAKRAEPVTAVKSRAAMTPHARPFADVRAIVSGQAAT